MNTGQIFFLGVTFVLILGVSLAAQFNWLGNGRVKTVVVFIAAVVAMLSLRISGLPPAWFSASKTGFSLAVSFIAGSFLGRSAEERSFAFPFLFGLGGTLFVVNVVDLVRSHL